MNSTKPTKLLNRRLHKELDIRIATPVELLDKLLSYELVIAADILVSAPHFAISISDDLQTQLLEELEVNEK